MIERQNRTDYLLKAEKYLSDWNTFKDVTFADNELVKLLQEENRIFKDFYQRNVFLNINASISHIASKKQPT